MYAPFDLSSPLSQGDIVKDVVSSYIPDISDPAFILGDNMVERDLTRPFDPNEVLEVLSQPFKSHVLIIHPSCNIDNDSFISVARIHPFQDKNYDSSTDPLKKAQHIKKQYQRVVM